MEKHPDPVRLSLALVIGVCSFYLIVDMTINAPGKGKRYHEIEWNTRSALNDLLDRAIADTSTGEIRRAAREQYAVLYPVRRVKKGRTAHPTEKEWAAIVQDSQLLDLMQTRDRIAALSDSALEASIAKPYLTVRLGATGNFRKLSPDSAGHLTDSLLSFLRIPGLPKKMVNGSKPLSVIGHDWDEFVARNPVFGAWSVLIVIQFLLFALLLPVLVGRLFTVPNAGASVEVPWFRIIFTIVLVLVCLAVGKLLVDPSPNERLVPAELFMKGMDDVFDYVNFIGYLTGGLCLCGMAFSVFDANALQPGNNGKLVPEAFEAVADRFQTFFLCAAVILSLAVFATRCFFSAVNSLPIIRVLSNPGGRMLFPYDFVYLYGTVHSFLILLFYIPVKLKLETLKTNVDSSNSAATLGIGAAPGTASSGSLVISGATGLLKKLTEVLIIGSPLLASLLQTLIDSLFREP